MKMPGFTAVAALYRSNGRYAIASMGVATPDRSVVRPQYCGPCYNGRRQCGEYGWVCERDPGCIFGDACPVTCHQGGFHTWSIPCGRTPVHLPFVDSFNTVAG